MEGLFDAVDFNRCSASTAATAGQRGIDVILHGGYRVTPFQLLQIMGHVAVDTTARRPALFLAHVRKAFTGSRVP